MSYIDGFVIPVPLAHRDAYVASAKKMTAFFERHGALRVVECWGDDVPDGKVTDFKRAVATQSGENVVFSWIEWPTKEARDKAGEAMMEAPEFMDLDGLFDGKRMIFGGFEVLLDFKGQQT